MPCPPNVWKFLLETFLVSCLTFLFAGNIIHRLSKIHKDSSNISSRESNKSYMRCTPFSHTRLWRPSHANMVIISGVDENTLPNSRWHCHRIFSIPCWHFLKDSRRQTKQLSGIKMSLSATETAVNVMRLTYVCYLAEFWLIIPVPGS
jgi:hypothetical protein